MSITSRIIKRTGSGIKKQFLVLLSCCFASLAAHAQVSVLTVGDSITRGFSGQPSYREEFVTRLTDSGCTPTMRGSQPNLNPSHEGYSGHEANHFIDGRGPNPGIKDTLAIYSPPNDPVDVLLLHIGTNDMIVSDSVSSTLNEIDDIIDIIKTDSPSTKIYLANVVPLYVTNDNSSNGRLDTGTDTDGDGFYDISNTNADAVSNGIEAKYANDPDIIVVDVRTGFRPTDMVADGIHPSTDDVIDPRSDSGEHRIAVAFAAALEANGDCTPTTPDDSFPLTFILSPSTGDLVTKPVKFTGQATDTGGDGFNVVRLAVLQGKVDDYANCNNCYVWWDFTSEQFGSFDSINAHLQESTTNYTEWRAGFPSDPGQSGININLPAGEYTLFALAYDGAATGGSVTGNKNYFNQELWPERTVFTVDAGTSPKTEDSQRITEVARVVSAMEDFAGSNGSYNFTNSGFRGNGLGWFHYTGGVYENSISNTLVELGHLSSPSPKDPLHPTRGAYSSFDFLVYRCRDRVAVFSKADDITPSSADESWWQSNNCTQYPVARLDHTYFKLSEPVPNQGGI